MGAGLTIEVSNQDYDIDVVLESTVVFNSSLVAGEGFLQAAGTPAANQIAVFTSPAIVRGYSNLTYDGTSLNTPLIKVNHIAENGLDHGIVFNHQVHLNDQKNVGSNNIIGFGGSGYEFSYSGGKAFLEIDDLVVRGRMAVYELIIQQISHIGGALFITAGNGEVKSYTGTNPFNLYFDTKGGALTLMFEVGDFVLAQKWSGSGVAQFEGTVTAVDQANEYITVSSTDTPWNGMDLIQFGHPTLVDRQNAILLKATDPVNPNNPVIVGYQGIDDGLFAGHMKFTLGNLAGIYDVDFGQLDGFGLFAENVYLKGAIQITAGSVDYTLVSGTKPPADATNGATWGTNLASVPDRFAYAETPPGEGIYIGSSYMGYYDGGQWATYMQSNGNFSLGDYTTSGLFWNQGTGVLNIKGAISITSGSVDYTLVSGTKPPADATNGATWGANLASVPDRFAYAGTPPVKGLYVSSAFMGYYNGSQWTSYIDDSGNCVFTGVGSFGTVTGIYGGITITQNQIYENSVNGMSYVCVNEVGYHGGTSQYRGFVVCDGKGSGPGHNMLYIFPYSGGISISMGDISYSQQTLLFEVFGSQKVYKNFEVHGPYFTAEVSHISLGEPGGTTRIYGSIGMGSLPDSFACLDLSNGTRQSGAMGALILPCLSQAEIDNLTGRYGMVVYNTGDNHVYAYVGNKWGRLD